MGTVAAIDIGTNTVRLLIQSSTGEQLAREVAITRLGQGVDVNGVLAAEAMDRTLAAIDRYRDLIQLHRPERLRIIATSAARDAGNRDEFFNAVAQRLEQAPELLSGDSEARLSFRGATLGSQHDAGPRVVVDIGGGSTELAYGRADVEQAISLNVGAVRITERHFRSDPPSPQQLAAALQGLVQEFTRAAEFRGLPKGTEWIGVAGSVTTIAAYRAGLRQYDPTVTHRMRLSRADVAATFQHFSSLPAAERRVCLIEPKRAETIVGSCAVLQAVYDAFDLEVMTVSETDILDGIALSLLS
jgi:exopolyphosphatase/guanosine-5'-triphosphate,3'-diphosphate pyrophosphatase